MFCFNDTKVLLVGHKHNFFWGKDFFFSKSKNSFFLVEHFFFSEEKGSNQHLNIQRFIG
jgi:hypothetical protein